MSDTEPALASADDEEEPPSLRSMIQDFLPSREETPRQEETLPGTTAPDSIAPAGSSDTGAAGSISNQDMGLLRDRTMFWMWIRSRKMLRDIPPSPPSPQSDCWTAANLRNYLQKQKMIRRKSSRQSRALPVKKTPNSKSVNKKGAAPKGKGVPNTADEDPPGDPSPPPFDKDPPPAQDPPGIAAAAGIERIPERKGEDKQEKNDMAEQDEGHCRGGGRGGRRGRGRGRGGRGGDSGEQAELGGRGDGQGGEAEAGEEDGRGRGRGKGRGDRGGGRGRGAGGRGGDVPNVWSARLSFIAHYMEEHNETHRVAAKAWLTSVERQRLIDAMSHAEAKRRRFI